MPEMKYDYASLSIAVHARRGKHRYAINSVLFSAAGTVATDGRCLIQVDAETPPTEAEIAACKPVLVPAVTILAGLAAVAAIYPADEVVSTPTEAVVEAGKLTLRVNDMDIVSLPFDPPDGTYPKFESVIPPQANIEARTPVRINVDARMLADLLDTIADMGIDGVELTVIPPLGTSNADRDYSKVRIDGVTELGREVLAVLMGRARDKE